jgi:hypothetical protein
MSNGSSRHDDAAQYIYIYDALLISKVITCDIGINSIHTYRYINVYIYIYIYIKEIIKKRTKRIFHNILVLTGA